MKIPRPTSFRSIADRITPGTAREELGSITVTGLSDDSRTVEAGDLFFCIPGARADGLAFAADAVKRGAVGLVVAGDLPGNPGIPVLKVADVRRSLSDAIGMLFAELLARPYAIGITGTNGKTTTTHLVGAVLKATGRRSTLVGTLGTVKSSGELVPSPNTTPGPLNLLGTIQDLVARGDHALVMEVSSQGIVQNRASYVPFQGTVFTNFSSEHMELHGDIDTYREVKRSFFSKEGRKARERGDRGFVNAIHLGDPAAGLFLDACQGKVVGYGLHRPEDPAVKPLVDRCAAYVWGEEQAATVAGARMIAHLSGQAVPVELKLGGRFNLQNSLAALAIGHHLAADPEAAARELAAVAVVPGRFQRVPSDKRQVIVDYAHTSEGLESLLSSCRGLVEKSGRLIVVFGCGGDRDPSKRPRMGRSASRYADLGVITSDNPRSEAPERITDMILTGIDAPDRARFKVQHDRREAIRLALEQATARDLVVVAGKGHENYQIMGSTVHPFDDVQVVRELLERL